MEQRSLSTHVAAMRGEQGMSFLHLSCLSRAEVPRPQSYSAGNRVENGMFLSNHEFLSLFLVGQLLFFHRHLVTGSKLV